MEKSTTIGADTLLAAIDLGSNSFRLEIAHHVGGQVQRVDYIKEAVRQGGGLDENRNLNEDAIERGLRCLERFGEAIKGFPKQNVRAVATQTLREARNATYFLQLARKALGYKVEVISGVEEARLIYQGGSHFLPQSEENRLVIDIGGRSTEFILGSKFDVYKSDSLRVGSVAWSLKYFPDGELSEKNFKRAELAAESFLDVLTDAFGGQHWSVAYGASGTVGAVADVLALAGFEEGIVSKKGLDWLRAEIIKAKHVDRLKLPGLKEDRNAVIGGGLSILRAVFSVLEIDTLHVAKGALRHGLFYDIAAEASDGLVYTKEASVNLLLSRFPVDSVHADRVRDTALHLYDQVVDGQQYKKSTVQALRRMLSWAAECHEIGAVVSHGGMHRHGAYILDHTELMGFSQSELHQLGFLVLGQYGKLKKLDLTDIDTRLIVLLACMRLAVIFCHARHDPDLKGIKKLQFKDDLFELTVYREWTEQYPQSTYLLEEETVAWRKTPWNFHFIIKS